MVVSALAWSPRNASPVTTDQCYGKAFNMLCLGKYHNHIPGKFYFLLNDHCLHVHLFGSSPVLQMGEKVGTATLKNNSGNAYMTQASEILILAIYPKENLV